jgi:hypothetical protein
VDGARAVKQTVRKRGFPVVNMGDDAEISNVRYVHLSNKLPQAAANDE